MSLSSNEPQWSLWDSERNHTVLEETLFFIHVQYCDFMRFTVLYNRHRQVSQSVSFFMHCKIVTILLRIRVRGHFVMSTTKNHESHYVTVLDNPRRRCNAKHNSANFFLSFIFLHWKRSSKASFHRGNEWEPEKTGARVQSTLQGIETIKGVLFVLSSLAAHVWVYWVACGLNRSGQLKVTPRFTCLREVNSPLVVKSSHPRTLSRLVKLCDPFWIISVTSIPDV